MNRRSIWAIWGVLLLVVGANASLAFGAMSPLPWAPEVPVQSQLQAETIMNPHSPPKGGTWFEGWYTRITAPFSGASFAVLGASVRGANDHASGYLMVLYNPPGSSKTFVREFFPQKTLIWCNGQPCENTSALEPDADFAWEAPTMARITQNSIIIDIPGEISAKVSMRKPIPWGNPSWPNWGPEGVGSFLSFLPLHWFVYSLGSESEFNVSILNDDQSITRYQGKGFAHQEKNWGSAFPPAWIWSEGISPGNRSHFALSGGLLEYAGLSVTTWLAAFSSSRAVVSYSPVQLGISYTTEFDSCTGKFKMVASNISSTMVVDASAPMDSFAPVSIPDAATGEFVRGGKESFTATVNVAVYDKGGYRSPPTHLTPVDQVVFEKAALEFGANYMKCGP